MCTDSAFRRLSNAIYSRLVTYQLSCVSSCFVLFCFVLVVCMFCMCLFVGDCRRADGRCRGSGADVKVS